jgi:exopolyphosphatase/guanosine-5'-triphosphate,3'-diphosphate pyrophosphatase
VENPSKTRRRSRSFAAAAPEARLARGRLPLGRPVAVVDIGSNSVRLVVYEGLSRSLTPIFNEKVLAGLGREVKSTGVLAADAVAEALSALKRFRALCGVMRVKTVHAIATAAVREAKDGAAFIRRAEAACGARIRVLSGQTEARFAAVGVAAGIHNADGVAGDLGGGSLELVDVRRGRIGKGATLPLGGLSLSDTAHHSLKEAQEIVRGALADDSILRGLSGRTFYAVGGTWRAMARLHMLEKKYPLRVTHGYAIPAEEAAEFARLVRRLDPDALPYVEEVSSARRPLLPYGALVLERAIEIGKPREIVFSALGVREGLLHEILSPKERAKDPLLAAARDLNLLRSRSPRHGEELIGWTDRFMASVGVDENGDERRLRHAACLLADIGWRAHPDYRGEQSLNIIAHAAFVGIDHPGRAFLALAVFYRHAGHRAEEPSPRLRELATPRLLDRARILGAAMRVAYLVSASMPGVLPRAPMRVKKGKLVLRLEGRFKALAGERLQNRLRQLAKLIDREPVLDTE